MLDGLDYRVIRKRSKARKTGQSWLDFQVRNNGSWKPLSGATIRETQQSIVSALRMDYDTFANSAYLRQGHADEFTKKEPGRRKQVLADILGLNTYEKLEGGAKERARGLDGQIKGLDGQIGELQRQAEALYWDQERVLRQTVLQPQCLGQEGQQDLWVSVRTHADPRLCDLQRSKCQEELIQAIYRIRPLSVEEGKLFPTEQGKRTEATVYVFSSLPIPQLKVQLVRKPPSQSTVIDLSAAAEAIHQRQERITEERLATQARVNRWKARQFLAFQLRSRLGEGPPPGQGPPPAA
jgi:DNA repair exonuclease SbcCD ATPase subunit